MPALARDEQRVPWPQNRLRVGGAGKEREARCVGCLHLDQARITLRAKHPRYRLCEDRGLVQHAWYRSKQSSQREPAAGLSI